MQASNNKSLLSSTIIREVLGKGIVIDPFSENQLKSCSYDVRLGKYFFRRQSSSKSGDFYFNPYDPDCVARHYGDPLEAEPANRTDWVNISPEDLIIQMEPGEMILGHTEEFIGGTKDPETGRCFTAEMKARSSVGRVGLEVCRCAGWGDVGYVNRWTMEIVCTSTVPVVLVVGTRLAQMKFYEVDCINDRELYGFDNERDYYQSGVDIGKIRMAWNPSMILPRLTKT